MNIKLSLLFITLITPSPASEIIATDNASLKVVLRDLKPGTTLKIAPGTYSAGHHIANLPDLTIEALDPTAPPVFKGGGTGWQFSRCHRLTLRNLVITGQTFNGLNLDDGGQLDHPTTGITLENLRVTDIGPTGNHDAIKCSGLDGLTIRGCTLEGWAGQGIDFVGCHHSLITGCRFIGKDGYTASAGIQLKGGTHDVIVEKCHFTHAGQRPINAGGSTGLAYFRPPGANYEAARLIIRDNLIEGSPCAIAFVGVDGAEFTGNTIRHPTKWIFRILQETREPSFVPCRNVLIQRNRILFRRGDILTDINTSTHISPETFRFDANHWLAEDTPEKSKPTLPVPETNATYGTPF